jgi:hypothetical protein
MKFPYARYSSYYMPIIPVTLSRGDRRIVTEALVDSGAASSLFDVQFAEALGMHDLIENGIEVLFEGVSGHTLVGYQHDMTLEIGGYRVPNVTIAFCRGMPDNAVNILGNRASSTSVRSSSPTGSRRSTS